MASYSALRLFLRWEKPGRLLNVGNFGVKHGSQSVFDGHKYLLLNEGSDWKNFKRKRFEQGTYFFQRQWRRYYSSSVSTKDVQAADSKRGSALKKAKTVESPKITLVNENFSLSVVTLEEAYKIAAKKQLRLVEVTDKRKISSDKPVYKLVTNAEYLEIAAEDVEVPDHLGKRDAGSKQKPKDVKSVMMSSKIGENDIVAKCKLMMKWIAKGHTIKIVIGQPADTGDSEGVYRNIEKQMETSKPRFIQKVVRGGQIRFQIMPPKDHGN